MPPKPDKVDAVAIVSTSAAWRRVWSSHLSQLPGLTVAGAWPSMKAAHDSGERIDAVLLDLGRGAPVPATRQGEAPLSPRENQVLALLAEGCRDKDLATRLGRSPNTTRTFLRRAMAKLGATSRTEAVAQWLRTRA